MSSPDLCNWFVTQKISLKIMLFGIHADLLIFIMHWMFKLYYGLSFSRVKYLEQS